MPAVNRYKLSPNYRNYGSENAIGVFNTNTFNIYPDWFVDNSTGAVLTNFTNNGIFYTSNCTGTTGDGDTYMTITPSASPFSFKINNDATAPDINGTIFSSQIISTPVDMSTLAYRVYGTHEINIKLSELCLSPSINVLSPVIPSTGAPYTMGSFIGYVYDKGECQVNINATNGGTVAYGSTYSYYAGITHNQNSWGTVTVGIYLNNVNVKTSSKDISQDNFFEVQSGTYTNNSRDGSTQTIRVDVSSGDYLIGTTTQTLTLSPIAYSGYLGSLAVGSPITTLNYDVTLFNNTAFSHTLYVKITNTTRSLTNTFSKSVPAGGQDYTGSISMGGNNYVGDSFSISMSADNIDYTTYYVTTTPPLTLNYTGNPT